jgi:hypothetical protein
MKIEIKSSHGKDYKVTETGTFYSTETPDALIEVLEHIRTNRLRCKFYYGDIETGRDYAEESDKIGTIGRSTGEIKIPLFIATPRSRGGSALFENIVMIKDINRRIIYKNPKYNAPSIVITPSDAILATKGYTHTLVVNGRIYSNHKSERAAVLLKTKLS